MPVIDDEIKELVLLAQKVIINFFEPLNEERKQILDKVFRETAVSYGDIDCIGKAYYGSEKKIIIKDTIKYNQERVLSCLVHEYCHMLTERNYETDLVANPEWLKEGIADVFADLVINKYFKDTYKPEVINGRPLKFELPFINYSGYLFENSFVRTLLYPLEKEGKDIEAVQEMVLGSPKKFIEMVTNKETSEQISYSPHGVTYAFYITLDEIYQNNPEAYHQINKESIYYLKNAILPRFVVNDIIKDTDEIKVYELPINKAYTSYFIENLYFKGKKIYELYPEELKQFIEIYVKTRLPGDYLFQEESYTKYINRQMKYLLANQEELRNNSAFLFENIPYFINDYDTKICPEVQKVISICIDEILNTIDDLEINSIDTQYVYYQLKNIIIPAYKKLEKDNKTDQYFYLMDTLNMALKKLEHKVIPIEEIVNTIEEMQIIGRGTSKKCYDLNKMVLLQAEAEDEFDIDYYYYINMLNENGILTPRIISECSVGKRRYVIEEKVAGTALKEYVPDRVEPITSEADLIKQYQNERIYVKKHLERIKELSQKPNVLEKFVDDYFFIIRSGGNVDHSKTTNFIYNEEGIFFIDLSLANSQSKMDEHKIFHSIMYNICWCESTCFSDEEIKEENKYLTDILNILKEICNKRNLNENEYFVDYGGNPLSARLQNRIAMLDEFKIANEEEYINRNREYIETYEQSRN